MLSETATSWYAWVLLPNHDHLLLRTGRVSIATVMKKLLSSYTTVYNRHHRRHGHLFQNRYKSALWQEELYLLELLSYIHPNRMRAKTLLNLNACTPMPMRVIALSWAKRNPLNRM
jgi:putative transposase